MKIAESINGLTDNNVGKQREFFGSVAELIGDNHEIMNAMGLFDTSNGPTG